MMVDEELGNATDPEWQPPVAITPFSGESLGGLLLRHCEANGWPNLSHFAQCLGAPPGQLRWGDSAERLARAAGVDVNLLAGRTRQRQGAFARLCGHRISLNYVDLYKRRICRQCLEDERFQREWWEINFFDTCPIHSVPMIDACHCGEPLTWKDSRLDRCDTCQPHERNIDVQVPRELSPLAVWIAERLQITSTEPARSWLDQVDLSFSLALFLRIGMLAEGGYALLDPISHMDPVLHIKIMESGFSVLTRDGLSSLISVVVGQFRSTARIDVPKNVADGLGWFGHWIANEDLEQSHPFLKRLLAALEAAYQFPVSDLHHNPVVHISNLATKLGLFSHETLAIVQRHRPMRGPYIPGSLARAIEEEYAGHTAEDGPLPGELGL